MSSKNAARLKALEQARSKLGNLTKHDVVSFTFIMSDEGPEMIGEESLTTEAMAVFEDRGLIDFAKRIRMRGNDLTHRSTLTMLKLEELTDYDLLRSLIYDVMKVEGLGTLWQPGEDPPQSMKDWWGEEEIDLEIFRMYETQNLEKPMMDKVRGKHARYKKNAIAFWKEKIVNCYRLRLGDQMDKYHMNLPKEQVEVVKQERLRREEQQRIRREADEEAERVRARELELEQEFNARLERAVQERVRERTRRAEEESSPERRRRSAGGQDDGGDGGDNDDQVEGGGRVPRNDREELQRRMDALENWEQDPNSSVLLDPAAVGVVRAPTARVDEIAGAGTSRASRQRLKCPVPACQVTRASQEALNAHIENSHD